MSGRQRVAAGLAGAAGLIAAFTLLSRIAGFARILVFTDSVRTGGVGGIYASVNALPNVVFEVAAGGTLAAAAVPLIAHRIGAGHQAAADRAASVMLTWVLVVLVPLGGLLALAADPIAGALVTGQDAAAHSVAVRLLRIFAVQVPLYGIGIILTAVLHAHRRFLAAALAPLLSSVVVLVSYLWYGSLTGGQTHPALVSATALSVLGWGTTLGVVVLSLPLLVPAYATGWRWRPALRLPAEDTRRIGGLAGAGLLALVAQQGAVLATIWLGKHSGDRGTFAVYTYAQAVYLLPYAVLAVPIAQSAFPALAQAEGAGRDAASTIRQAIRAVVAFMAMAAGVLIAVAPAVGPFFAALDHRGDGVSSSALTALPAALTAYAPGLIGFGLVALLTRALYAKGRARDAGVAAAVGWALAAIPPLLVVGSSTADPSRTLSWLGAWSSIGMTVAGGALVWLVRRAAGATVTDGLGRLGVVAIIALGLAALVGRLVLLGRTPQGLGQSLLFGVLSGAVALVVGAAVVGVGDRSLVRDLRSRSRVSTGGGAP